MPSADTCSSSTPASSSTTVSSNTKTPLPRRRRKVGGKASATPSQPLRVRGGEVVDKENRGNVLAAITERLLLDDDDLIFRKGPLRDEPDDDHTLSGRNRNNNDPSSSTSVIAETLLEFQSALSQVSVDTDSGKNHSASSSSSSSSSSSFRLFAEHPQLDESVIRCSLAPQLATGLWHVQEHANALLSLSRKLIKQSTMMTTTTEKGQTQQQQQQQNSIVDEARLLIAVHNLRAIVALPEDDAGGVGVGVRDGRDNHNHTRTETCLRLLYHLITTASERMQPQSQQQQPQRKSTSSSHWKLGLIVLSGLEALQSLLLQYSCHPSSSTDNRQSRIVRFRRSRISPNISSSSSSSNAADRWERAAVPFWQNTATGGKTTESSTTAVIAYGTMTLRQVSTIALKACIAGASACQQLLWQIPQQGQRSSVSRVEVAAARYGHLAARLLSSQSGSHHHHPFLNSIPQMQLLLQSCYTPWLIFLADSNDNECTQDVSAHCKAAHRLLWDAAAKLKAGASADTTINSLNMTTQEVEDGCLDLRRQAIELLVPAAETQQGQALICGESSSSQWESACSYAWKAASVYVQQQQQQEQPHMSLPVPSASALYQFHGAVGTSLDRFCGFLPNTQETSTMPVSYVEYCVHRAMHCGVVPPQLNAAASSLMQRCGKVAVTTNTSSSAEEDEHCVGVLILSTALIGVHAKYQLSGNGNMMDCNKTDLPDYDADPEYLHDLVANFESTVLPRWASLLDDTRNRYFKLLSSTLSLHRTIFHALKSPANSINPSVDSSILSNNKKKQHALETLSVVLSRCIGPLALAAAKSASSDGGRDKDSSAKVNAMLELAVECYIRPLAALERLSETCCEYEGEDEGEENEDDEYRYRMLANETIKTMHRMFFMQDMILPSGLLEKCAKSIALIARQRTDRSLTEASIPPTLYSIPMYQFLSRDRNSHSNYQLSARLAHLANALQSSGKYHQAMVVLACVIAQELPDCYDGGDDQHPHPPRLEEWKEIDFVHFFAARSKNVFCPLSSTEYQPTALTRSSIRRLLALVPLAMEEQNSRSMTSTSDPAIQESMQHAWEAFLVGLDLQSLTVDGTENNACRSVAWLLPNVLQSHEPNEDPRAWMLQSFLLFVDVMVELGSSIQGDSLLESSSSEARWQAADCILMARHLESSSEYLSQLMSSSSPNILPIFVKVVCSSSLTQSKGVDYSSYTGDIDETRLGQAIQLAREAGQELEALAPFELDGQGVALATVVSYFCCRTEARQGETTNVEMFQCFQTSMTAFRKVATNANSDIVEFCRKSFLWTLSHFQIQLEASGDSVRSVIAMHWILELIDENDMDECAWFRSTAVSTFLSNPLSTLEVLPYQHSNIRQATRSMEWFAQTELTLASLRAQISLSDPNSPAASLAKVARSIKPEIEAVATSAGKRDVISQWLLCSVELTLAECAAAAGTFTNALKHLQESSRHCMAVLSSARFCAANAGDLPIWENVARSTLQSRAKRRYAELLGLRSKLYSRMGDHRKAVSYLATLADFLGIDLMHVDKELGPDVEAMLVSGSDLGVKQFRRLNAEIRCSASSLDAVANGLEGAGMRWPQEAWSESDDVSRKLQVVLDVLSVGDLVYGESIKSPFQSSFPEFYQEAMNWYTTTLASSNLLGEDRSLIDNDSTPLSAKVAIREIRCLLHLNSILDRDNRSQVRALCEQVWENKVADPNDRAWAHYYAADLEIATLRQSGGFGRLWIPTGDETSDEDQASLGIARDHLRKAAASHAIGSDILSRIILRSLALVTGRESGSINNASAGALVLMSIGQSYRQLMLRSLSDATCGDSNRVEDLFHLFNICEEGGVSESGKGVIRLLDRLAEVAPHNWKFVAATLCPSGDVLVTSIEKDVDVGEMSVETSRIEPQNGGNAYDDIMVPLDEIIRESQNQLYGMDVSAVSERFSKEEAKRKWWDDRHRLDEDLQTLLERVENSYFPSMHLKAGSTDCIFFNSESNSLPIGNLASKFEAAVEEIVETKMETSESLKKLTVPKLKERLRDEFGFSDSTFRKMKKQDLIDLILSEIESRKQQQIEDVLSDGCLFLILDENLHRFPFEGMPSLAGHSVCRVPSLSFVLGSLLEQNLGQQDQTCSVDPSRASYVLDPESNLISTRKRLKPVLDRIATEHGWEWDSAVGEIPGASFFEDGLMRQDSLFMYFGHGGAQTCYSRKQVESLMCQRDGHEARACNATVILMGCSSGRLVSVNRKHSQALEQIPLYYEPEGIALSYLCAGAPCVVGNLWDVTDHDIDRYSTTLLEKFLQGGDQDDDDSGNKATTSSSLASCVATSRSACKLRFIVGCAPVCYGVPVHFRGMY